MAAREALLYAFPPCDGETGLLPQIPLSRVEIGRNNGKGAALCYGWQPAVTTTQSPGPSLQKKLLLLSFPKGHLNIITTSPTLITRKNGEWKGLLHSQQHGNGKERQSQCPSSAAPCTCYPTAQLPNTHPAQRPGDLPAGWHPAPHTSPVGHGRTCSPPKGDRGGDSTWLPGTLCMSPSCQLGVGHKQREGGIAWIPLHHLVQENQHTQTSMRILWSVLPPKGFN